MKFKSIDWKSPFVLVTISVFALVVVASACTDQGQGDKASRGGTNDSPIKKTPVTQPSPEPVYQAPISEWATRPYTQDIYPKTFAKYGSRMSELQTYREKAALLASKNTTCDEVISSEISDRGSLSNMQFFVDCENGTRFRFSEGELNSSDAIAVSEADKIISESNAERRCEEMIMASVTHPSTTRIYPLQKAFRTVDQTGVGIFQQGFEAKNSFGVLLKFTATCSFQSDGKGEITIVEQKS